MYTRDENLDLIQRILQGTATAQEWTRRLAESAEPLDLREVDLSTQLLRGLTLTACNLAGANLSGTCLQDADLSRADLTGAQLKNADLRGANLSYAQASGACFDAATVVGADLSWANMTQCTFVGVDLNKARLWKTDLRGATFEPFEPGKGQDFVSEGGRLAGQSPAKRRVPFTRMLRVVGAMAGIPHHWRGEGEVPLVELPDAGMDPAEYLEAKIQEYGFKRLPRRAEDGSLNYYEVTTG